MKSNANQDLIKVNNEKIYRKMNIEKKRERNSGVNTITSHSSWLMQNQKNWKSSFSSKADKCRQKRGTDPSLEHRSTSKRFNHIRECGAIKPTGQNQTRKTNEEQPYAKQKANL